VGRQRRSSGDSERDVDVTPTTVGWLPPAVYPPRRRPRPSLYLATARLVTILLFYAWPCTGTSATVAWENSVPILLAAGETTNHWPAPRGPLRSTTVAAPAARDFCLPFYSGRRFAVACRPSVPVLPRARAARGTRPHVLQPCRQALPGPCWLHTWSAQWPRHRPPFSHSHRQRQAGVRTNLVDRGAPRQVTPRRSKRASPAAPRGTAGRAHRRSTAQPARRPRVLPRWRHWRCY
jgi:hypothetical protein